MCVHVHLFILLIYFGLYTTINAILVIGWPSAYSSSRYDKPYIEPKPCSIPNYVHDNNINELNSQLNEIWLARIKDVFKNHLEFIVFLIKPALSHLKTYW